MQVNWQLFSQKNEVFSRAPGRKLESWKVSYGQEAKRGFSDGNTTAL